MIPVFLCIHALSTLQLYAVLVIAKKEDWCDSSLPVAFPAIAKSIAGTSVPNSHLMYEGLSILTSATFTSFLHICNMSLRLSQEL